MFKAFLRMFLKPLHWVMTRPSLRYSFGFDTLRSCVTYTPRETMLSTSFGYCADSRLDGDYLEFGVYEGATFSAAYHLAQLHGRQKMRFYAFDSFQGLPAPQGLDQEGFQQFRAGQYKCEIDRFQAQLARRRVPMDKVHCTPGWFDQVLNEQTKRALSLRQAAVVWIDCDLYESTVPVLNFITDYLQDGTILIFDDWYCFRGDPERGEQKAFKEWLAQHPDIRCSEYHRFGWHGHSFIVHRTASPVTGRD